MTSEQSATRQSRHGCGIFDCPVDGCHEAIIGAYRDLLDHFDDDHPLAAVVDVEEGITLPERVKQAQRAALEADIQEQMVVSDNKAELRQHNCADANREEAENVD